MKNRSTRGKGEGFDMVLILLRWARLGCVGRLALSLQEKILVGGIGSVEKAGNVSASVRTNQRKIGRTHPRDLKKITDFTKMRTHLKR
jgi:hypothetical protein